MRYTQLGKTDLIVSRICFGCWQLSPRFWGQVSIDEWNAALRRAIDLGVNFIDTADAYGDGAAESALGNFIAREKCRDKLVIATKFLWNFEQAERFPDTRYEYILRECDASLRRLKTDYIDLYQIHAWDPLMRPDEVAAAFGKLKKEGKVRWFGVSNFNAAQMRMCLRYFNFECLQPLYNMLDRAVESDQLPFCLEHKIGVITYSSLAKGLLTGKYTAEQKFEDHRAVAPRFTGEEFKGILEKVQKLAPIAEKHGLSIAQFAVRWILTHPAVTAAIVGIKKPEHIESIVKAAEGILPVDDWHKGTQIMSG
jgi:aryl-alcohol dehydrogenase-like predicted oxidoreductase